ncbi:MAG TPA: HAMP domain-containing sensor histidine kinase [Pirellulales bacterium]|jgi:signal transduction histidine kinase|nr:HAMP domain-containing sensor histidine kinase [Pirellulales bacterium]
MARHKREDSSPNRQDTAEQRRLDDAERRLGLLGDHVAMLHEENRAKDEFLAVLAHELRNPLAPILNGLEAMELIGLRNSTLEGIRAAMLRQTRSLVRLVDDLRDFSHVSRHRLELQKERIDVATIGRRAAETVRALFDDRGHQLSILLPPEPLTVEGDPLRLEQIFVNLLNNAAKYTSAGGHIWLAVYSRDHEAVISVRDNGRGIEPEFLPRVFERFYRGQESRTRGDGGLGIGLSLVQNLVELHGGRVEAFSEGRGKGSEFVVRLPVRPVSI